MSDRAALRVITYDIADDRRRRRVAEILEAHAVRVQESVFEWRASERKLARLMVGLRALVTAEDSLRVYTIPDGALPRCETIGGVAIADGGRFWLV
jgi:CRISPR-associated protein Cas2